MFVSSINARIKFSFLISTLCASHKLSVGELPRKDNIHLVLPPEYIRVLPVFIQELPKQMLLYLSVVFAMIQLVTRPSPEILRGEHDYWSTFVFWVAKYQQLLA